MRTTTKTLICWALAVGFCLGTAHVAQAQRSFGGFGGGGFGGGGFGGGFGRSSYGGSSSRYGGSSNSDGSRALGQAIIQYDPDTGSVIVVADEETNARVKSVIEGLDRPVPQVLIKVLFLEVTHAEGSDLGAEINKLNFTSNHGTKTNDIKTLFGLASEPQGGFYKIIDDDFEATIRAIADSNKLEVLSRPSVLTRNNQEAVITVGQEVPFVTNTQITNQGNTINTIEYSDIGIILRVTPHIAPDRTVEMQITPEISTLTADTVPISENLDARVVAKRSADTRVLVGDGKTVVIGGMMENNNTEKVTKIPLLGDIPYAGALFRRKIMDKSKTELLIFLTPLVVGTPEEVNRMAVQEKDNVELSPKAFSNITMEHFLNQVDVNSPKIPGDPKVQMMERRASEDAAVKRETTNEKAQRELEAAKKETPKVKVTGLIKAKDAEAAKK